MRVSILLLATLAALLACDSETTAPAASTAEIRVAHAAAGAGAFSVALDGEVLTPSLELGAAVGDTVTDGNHAVEFRTGDHETTMPVRTFGALVGVVLMGTDAATPRVYPHTRRGSGANLRIINAVPDRRLTTRLSGDGVRLAATLDYADASGVAVPAGEYAVTVSEDDPEERMELGSVTIPNGRAFVVIHPAAGQSGSLGVLTF